MGYPSLPELFTLAVLGLLIFGPERLPGMARTAGRMIAKFKREASATLDELKRTAEFDEIKRAANLDELRGVANDLKAEGEQLTRAAAMTGPVASAASARGLPAGGPTPYDPDAT